MAISPMTRRAPIGINLLYPLVSHGRVPYTGFVNANNTKETTMTFQTRSDFVRLCGGVQAAMGVETQILSVGSEFLPVSARIVRDGGAARPDYWIWLCAQAAKMRQEERSS
jgi:hypothetical protein